MFDGVEMMGDLINRSALIEDIKECYTDEFLAEYGFDKLVVSQQTVEAKPVVHGEWIKTFRYMRKNINTGKLEPVYSCDCPICKYHTGNQGVRFNFCPNCGADMRKKVQECVK